MLTVEVAGVNRMRILKSSYLLVILAVLSVISLFIGVSDLNLISLIRGESSHVQILVLSRIPRLMAIIITGMGMSVSGLIMQQLSRNKFVAPSTSATIDSAKLGVLVSMVLFPGAKALGKMSIAASFAFLGTFLFMALLKRIKIKNAIFIPLIGIMLGSIIDSVTTFFAYRFDMIQNVSSFLMGNFSMVIQGRYELLYLSIPMMILAMLYAKKFTIAGMGEEFATNLGLNYNTVVNIGLGIVSVISALSIITVGRIPFIGLVVPNIVSLYYGDNLEHSLGTTAVLGSVFLLVCDIIGRVIIYPYEISIGLTVGVIGSFIFLLLLARRKTA